ncbi:MAG: DUF3592 domain-containing protein [Anaerolineae bacterium]|nr:DUF3592 domain-containing protein [Anaerolineae bacterium]
MNALPYLVVLLVAIALSLGLYALLTRTLARLNDKALTQRGVAAEASITAVEEKRLPRRLLAYGITYRYLAVTSQGTTQTYVGREAVEADEFPRFRVGHTIWIHYLPDRPEISRRSDALAKLPGRKIGG